MNITEILDKRLSKTETEQLAKVIGGDPEIFAQLFKVSISGDTEKAPRAAWLIDHLLDRHPTLLSPHLAKAVSEFGNMEHHNSIHRNLGKSLLRVSIPDDLQGELYDTCVAHLLSPPVAIAIKAHAMEIATRIALPYEELRSELLTILLELVEDGSPGVVSRGKRMIKILNAA
ncbi:MAG: hypothetical protein AAFO94_10180 [Bacteroidota bacterium]